MKYVVMIILISIFCSYHSINAKNAYTSLKDFFVSCAENIERIDDIPLIGKFTNLLPFAAIVACCKECPGQTMAVIIGLFFCGLSHSESFRSILSRYNVIWGHNHIGSIQYNETLNIINNDKDKDEKNTEKENNLVEKLSTDDEYNLFRDTQTTK